jgi:hypothetical protein
MFYVLGGLWSKVILSSSFKDLLSRLYISIKYEILGTKMFEVYLVKAIRTKEFGGTKWK